MRKIFLFSITYFLFGNAFAQNWEFVGPSNFPVSSAMGVINHLITHNDGKIYASSPDGGLWVNQDFNTANWAPISDYLPTLEVKSFDVSRQNSDVIYLALRGSLLYKSIDAGNNWIKLPVDKRFGEINILKTSIINSDIIFVGTKQGLFKSTDGGNSFTTILNDNDVTDIKIDFSNPNIIFAGCRFVGVRKSTDEGDSWNMILPSPVTSGRSPSMIKIGIGVRDQNRQLESVKNRTIVAKIGTNVYLSKNGGNDFDDLLDLSIALRSETAGGSSRRTDRIIKDWNNAVEINPFNSDEFYIGQEKFYKVTGQAGNFVDSYAGHEDVQCISHPLVAGNGNMIFLANDGGVYKSTNGGDTFTKFLNNLSVAQLIRAGINNRTIVANSDHNGIIGVENYHETSSWRRVINKNCGYGNNGMEDNGVYIDNNNESQYYVFFNTLLRLNFPRTGTGCNGDVLPISTFKPYKSFVFPSNPQCGITTVIKNCRILPTIKRKYIWVARDKDDNEFDSYGLMYTSQGFKNPTGTGRTDVGNLPEWQEAFDTGDDPIVNIEYHSPSNTLYAITANGKLYLTQPSFLFRNNWIERNSIDALPEIFDIEVPLNNGRKIYAISENTLYISSNRGASWTEIKRNKFIPVDKFYSILTLEDKVRLYNYA